METELTSKDIRERIKARGLTMIAAAELLGMTRQNLNKHLASDKLSSHFIRLVKEKLPPKANVDTIEIPKRQGIPFYNMDVSASNVDVFNDVAETSVNISVPGFSDCEFAFPVYGHSMYPIYESGCIIICKRLRDLDVINYGEAYLIITNEQRLLKRVMKGESGETILLTSDNNELGKHGKQKYESFEMKKDKIKHLFLIKGSIKRNQI